MSALQLSPQWPPPTSLSATALLEAPCSAHTLKIAVYLALISSAWARIAAGSSFMILMSPSGRRPALGLASACGTYWPLMSTSVCWPALEHIQLWNSRAALGLGAALNTALGLLISGAPSIG